MSSFHTGCCTEYFDLCGRKEAGGWRNIVMKGFNIFFSVAKCYYDDQINDNIGKVYGTNTKEETRTEFFVGTHDGKETNWKM
jgi:hypothetical protein